MIRKLLNIINGRQEPDDILARLEQSGGDATRRRLNRLDQRENRPEKSVQSEFDDYIWTMTGELEGDADIQKLIAGYKAEADRVTAPRLRRTKYTFRGDFFSTWFKPATALAGAAALFAAFVYSPGTTVKVDTFATAIGDQRVVELADASKVTLNTNTQVRVQYSDSARDIYLDRGEAIFSVEKDKARPFNVYVGDALVRAVGTEFNIYLDQSGNDLVTVSVLEGIVTILQADERVAQPSAPLLEAGDAVSLTSATALSPKRPVDIARIAGWRGGQIVFRDISLDEAVRDHNRYAMQKIVLDDTSLAAERISGTFKVGDSEALLFALENLLNVQVQRSGNTLLISKHKS